MPNNLFTDRWAVGDPAALYDGVWESDVEWTLWLPFERSDDKWGFMYRRRWQIAVRADKVWNDSHFWLTSTSASDLSPGASTHGPPPGHTNLFGMDASVSQDTITYIDGSGAKVTATSGKMSFDPAASSTKRVRYPKGTFIYIDIYTKWYDDKASVPPEGDVVVQLTMNGRPVT